MSYASPSHELGDLVELLAVPHRAKQAYRQLRSIGAPARAAVTRGLAHDDPGVRKMCCVLLDHLADESTFANLIAMLADPVSGVRFHALHALACDRCKAEGCSLPDKSEVLPRAIEALESDSSPHVRAIAVEVVARWAHTDAEAELALVAAHTRDPSPAVRKKAGWFAPGGTIYKRTQPKSARR
ncbi:MAG TPA: HEAT repeat domain-containing protein [Acidimicrobiales bacterium]|nr:HEAT repeat domain-containing protein [Acidimicrobiales bacterium]